MNIYFLGSGSSGNATIIDFDGELLGIDLGITAKQYNDYLKELDINFNDIEGFLITHEHIDHIRSISMAPLNKLYSSESTLDLEGYNYVRPFQEFNIGNYLIKPIPNNHDCHQGLSYVITCKKKKIVYITDTGSIPSSLYKHLKNADYYVFESNYDYEMLWNSSRPLLLKRRISSPKDGHLSNAQCAILLSKLIGKKTKGIILCHISEDCNKYDLAIENTIDYLKEKDIDISNIKVTCAKQRILTIFKDEEN